MTRNIEIYVLIPTRNRTNFLYKALMSIINQKYKPKIVIVINDSDEKLFKLTEDIICKFDNEENIFSIPNKLGKGLSNSINTGLDYIKNNYFVNKDSFISLLDDDDWWDENYLEVCKNCIIENNAEWIITGLIRYDQNNTNGLKMTIPKLKDIDINVFLIKNPNIQGSNLFILANKLFEIGGFDGNLSSTTDRDVCIRLLQSGISKITIIDQHLVHHWAYDDHVRLSTPGNIQKKHGTQEFYNKYKSIMSSDQKLAFKERAKELFHVTIDDS